MTKSLPFSFHLVFLVLAVFLSACSHDKPNLDGEVTLNVSQDIIRLVKQGDLYISDIITVEYSNSLDVFSTPKQAYSRRPYMRILAEQEGQMTFQLVFSGISNAESFNRAENSVRFLSSTGEWPGQVYNVDGVAYTDVSLRIIDTFSVNQSNFEFNLSTYSEAQEFVLEIGDFAGRWNVRTDVNWLSFSQTEGVGSAQINLSIDPAKFSVSEKIDIAATVYITDEETGFKFPVFIQGSVSDSIVISPTVETGTIILPRPVNRRAEIKLFSLELVGPSDHDWYISSDPYYVDPERNYGSGPAKLDVIYTHYSYNDLPNSVTLTVSDQLTGVVSTIERKIEFVDAVSVDNQSLAYSFSRSSPKPESLTQVLNVIGPDQAWNITSDYDWLVFSQTEGVGPGTLDISVDVAQLNDEDLANGIQASFEVNDLDAEISFTVDVSVSSYAPIELADRVETLEYVLPKIDENIIGRSGQIVVLDTLELVGSNESNWSLYTYGEVSAEPGYGMGPSQVDLTYNYSYYGSGVDKQYTLTIEDYTYNHSTQVLIDIKFVDAVIPVEREIKPVFPSTSAGEDLTRVLTLAGVDNAWTIQSDLPWLSFSATEGQGPQDVVISFNPEAMDDPDAASGFITIIDSVSGISTEVEIVFVRDDSVVIEDNGQTIWQKVNLSLGESFVYELEIVGNESHAWDLQISNYSVTADSYTGTGPSTVTIQSDRTYNTAEWVTFTLTDRVTQQVTTLHLYLEHYSTFLIEGDDNGEFTFTKPAFNEMAPMPQFTFQVTGNSFGNWELTSHSDWLGFSQSSGRYDRSVDAYVYAMEPGDYEGSFTFTDTNSGYSQTYAVKGTVVPVAEDRLMLEKVSVAFSHFAGEENPSASIKVGTGLAETEGSWTASTEATWLTFDSSGNINGDLAISADPALLAPNTLHEAIITISSDELPNVETLHVALWVGEELPGESTALEKRQDVWAMDPLRPYAYLVDRDNTIDVLNLYTGQIIRTIEVDGGSFGALVVSNDGKQLFAYDFTSTTIQVIDLLNDSVSSSWDLSDGFSGNMGVVRSNGEEFLVASNGDAFHTATGTRFRLAVFEYNNNIHTSPLDNKFCLSGWSEVVCYTLDHWNLLNDLRATFVNSIFVGSQFLDVAIDSRGDRFYAVSHYEPKVDIYDFASFERLGSLDAGINPLAVELGPNGNVYTASSELEGSTDITVYNQNHTRLGYIEMTESENATSRGITISGDGRILLALIDDDQSNFGQVVIQPISY